MKTLFIGDSHLESRPDPQRLNRLLKLLDTVEAGDTVVLLGDIFDFWFEYPGVVQAGHVPVLCRFREVSERARMLFVPGNHDIWAGELLEEFGPRVYPNGTELELDGKRVWVEHGDMIGKQNRLARGIMGNRVAIWLYARLHPEIGIPFASWVSKRSRQRSSAMSPGDGTLPDWLFEGLPPGVRAGVIGHFHIPAIRRRQGVALMCVGDWMENFTYGLFEAGSLFLMKDPGQVLDKEEL